MEALNQLEVHGILVDTYAAGSRPDLFNDPSLRVAKVLDYKMAYGLVTAGHAIKLRQCFLDFLNVNKVDIYFSIVNNVRQVQVNIVVGVWLVDLATAYSRSSIKVQDESHILMLHVQTIQFGASKHIHTDGKVKNKQHQKYEHFKIPQTFTGNT